jgi:mycothiol S-conjugate amidase
MHEKFLELGLDSPFDDERLERMRRDEPVTTSIDLTGFTEVRAEALRAHATQVDPASPYWFGLPDEVLRTIYPFDDYFLARSRVGPAGAEAIDGDRGANDRRDVKEDDLFAGVR